jgi:hypothetical protein
MVRAGPSLNAGGQSAGFGNGSGLCRQPGRYYTQLYSECQDCNYEARI